VNLSVWNVLAVSKQRCEGETIRRRYRRYLRISRRLRRMTDHAVPAFNRFASRVASRAEAAIVTARQSRLVDPGRLSISSNSSSQSTADSRAWSGPCNSFTALMNAENSRSAIRVCFLQIELKNESFVFIGSSSVSAMPGTRSGAFSIGVHKCDHTPGVDTKQLDDGIDHTFVSAARVRRSDRVCSLSFVPLDVHYVVVDPALEN